MMAFVEVIEQEWDKNGKEKIRFKRHSNSPHSAGRVTSHPAKNFSQGTLFDIFCILYVDDGAFTFSSRYDLEKGVKLVYETFAKLGPQMHIGTTEKASKTEFVFFPAPGHFDPPAIPQSSTEVQLTPATTQPKQENAEQKQKRQDALYDGASETMPIKIWDLGIITFTRHFKYLGGYCSYSLKDACDSRLSTS